MLLTCNTITYHALHSSEHQISKFPVSTTAAVYLLRSSMSLLSKSSSFMPVVSNDTIGAAAEPSLKVQHWTHQMPLNSTIQGRASGISFPKLVQWWFHSYNLLWVSCSFCIIKCTKLLYLAGWKNRNSYFLDQVYPFTVLKSYVVNLCPKHFTIYAPMEWGNTKTTDQRAKIENWEQPIINNQLISAPRNNQLQIKAWHRTINPVPLAIGRHCT